MVQSNKSDFEFDNDSHTPFAYASYVDNNNSSEQEAAPPALEWGCPQCTLLNPIATEFCDACMMEQPTVPGTVVAQHPYYVEVDAISHASEITHDEQAAMLEQQRPLLTRSGASAASSPRGMTTTATTSTSIPVVLETENEGEDPLHKKHRRRRRRRVRMMAAGTGGLVVGVAIACGPVVPLVGAAAGVAGARFASKRRERAKDERVTRRLASREEATSSCGKSVIPPSGVMA
jgi:hypothetical protein